jgi:DNA-binding NtrC family response regulator
MANILVVDNDEMLRSVIAVALEKAGHKVIKSPSGDDAVQLVRKNGCDIIVADLNESQPDGISLLKTFRNAVPDADVIMMTGCATIEKAVEAMKSGAWDYVMKPPSLQKLSLIINRVLEKRQLAASLKHLQKQVAETFTFKNIVAGSEKMLHALELARTASKCNNPILITGESGTGKRLIANTIHATSARRQEPFISVDLSSVDQKTMELVLFGSVGGIDNGDMRSMRGSMEQADGGSILLCEIVNATPRVQEKLVELFEYNVVSRVGSEKMIYVNTRSIITSSEDIAERVRRGKFREDLFHQISQNQIHLPPLKERKDDIPLLAAHFMRKYSEQLGKPIQGVSQKYLSPLMTYHWPGNVRELKNAIENALTLTNERIVPISVRNGA